MTIPHTRSVLPFVLLAASAAGIACGAGGADTPGSGAAPKFGADQGVGTPYGTHDPRTCPDRKQPTSGAPSPAQAAAYVVCGREGVTGSNIYLVDHVQVTGIAKGRPYNPNEDINMPDVDVTVPVYAIKGSFTNYQCSLLTTPGLRSVGFADNRGKNCNAGDQPDATGLCYRDTFGGWHCSLLDVAHAANTRSEVAPPSA